MQDVHRDVSDNWSKLEEAIETRVAEILGGIGIANTEQLDRLSDKLQVLSDQVADLEKKLGPKTTASKPKPASNKKAATKTETTG